jgi:uncharacterized membrane protein YuzA (DUF378 family)
VYQEIFGQKHDRNRHVYAIIGLPTPMTLIVIARFRCQQRFINLAVTCKWLSVLDASLCYINV